MNRYDTSDRQVLLLRARGAWGPVRLRAFTLVEVLVVIAILALLLSIMVPSLQRIRQVTLDVKCRANLKRLSDAFHLGPDSTTIPNPWSWISAADAVGAAGVTFCPLGAFEDGGSQTPVQTSGAVVSISAPPSVVFNDFESNSNIHMFTERRDYPLPSNVAVDISEPGYYESNYSRTSTVITAGTAVDCHFVFFDPVGRQSCNVAGAITFGSEIMGIICTRGPLDATDSVLGAPTTRYDTGRKSRNFESGKERITFSEDRRTITINNFHSTYPGENMRVITRPGSGGSGSYGMNVRVDPEYPRSDQILLIDYSSSVVSPMSGWHETALEDMEDEGRLHLGKHYNGAMTDGSVKRFTPEELQSDSPQW